MKRYIRKALIKLEKEYRRTDGSFRIARIWSNCEIRRFSHLFSGSVINVSAWRDEDKEGSYYEYYFHNAKSYQISNYRGTRGMTGRSGEIYLDLEDDLPKEYCSAYDLVFNHTTLEHVFNFKKGFKNLCLMSRDCVMLVVPFLQEVHINDSYLDYWRFTPHGIRKLFKENGFEVIYESSTQKKNASVYLFFIAVKNSEMWKTIIVPSLLPETAVGNHIISESMGRKVLGYVLKGLKRILKKIKTLGRQGLH